MIQRRTVVGNKLFNTLRYNFLILFGYLDIIV